MTAVTGDPRGAEPPAEFDPRVVLYADGGLEALDPAARAAFEQELQESADLRRKVARARLLRRLVNGLPRRGAPLPALDDLLNRLDAEPSPALARALAGLRRRQAPAELDQRLAPCWSGRRVVVRPAFRRPRVGSFAAAAAVLFSAFALFQGAREQPPRHARLAGVTFQFQVNRAEPGGQVRGTHPLASPNVPRGHVPPPIRDGTTGSEGSN